MTKHVAIVGAGVVGLCTALSCADRGFRVTVVERDGPERDGCSFGNAGMIVPSHFIPLAAPGAVAQGVKWMLDPASPFYVKPRGSWELLDWGRRFWSASNERHVRRAAPLLRDLHQASRERYRELAAAGDDFALAHTGTLMLCKTEHALDEEARTAQYARELGVEAQVLDAAQTAALDPALRMDVVGSVYFPSDSHLDPGRLMAALQRRAGERGVAFAWNTQVSGFRRERGMVRALTTRGAGEVEADELVLAAGSWSPGVARALDLRLPLQPGKGYSLTLRAPRALPRSAAILTEARVAVSAMGDALRVGGTMELAGMDESVNPLRVRSIIEATVRYYPDLAASDFQGIAPWRGLRPCSPDGLPYLGRTARASNVIIATGHAMMGVSLAPITGKLVAQLLAGERPDVDLSLLSPDRYH